MLQHSRSSAGKKELTNINVLADEYLRLAYHGMKAKEKSFNVDVKPDFDDSIPQSKCDTAGYRSCDLEFNYQCFLCC
jgi:hypothetical protein